MYFLKKLLEKYRANIIIEKIILIQKYLLSIIITADTICKTFIAYKKIEDTVFEIISSIDSTINNISINNLIKK